MANHCNLRKFLVWINLIVLHLTAISGIPQKYESNHGNKNINKRQHFREKRSTPEEHANIVKGFLSDLEETLVGKDIVFILERSSFIGNKDFYLNERNLLYNFIKQYLRIKPGFTNIAVITYGKDVSVSLDYITPGAPAVYKCSLIEESFLLDTVSYIEGEQSEEGVNVREALIRASDILWNRRYSGKKQYVVLMTSGQFEVSPKITELQFLSTSCKERNMFICYIYCCNRSNWLSNSLHVSQCHYPQLSRSVSRIMFLTSGKTTVASAASFVVSEPCGLQHATM